MTDPKLLLITRAMALKHTLAAEKESLEFDAPADALQPFRLSVMAAISRILLEIDLLLSDCQNGSFPIPQLTLSRIKQRAVGIFGEIFALKLAPYVRNGIDSGMCLIADRLLQELSKAVTFELPQLTTIAESEFFGVYSRVIRIRFPSTSFWDLPVLAHEFSHSYAPFWHVPEGVPPSSYESFVSSRTLGSRSVNEEYFCDLLATYLLGPAYPLMCLADRFDPTSTVDSQTHPSDAKRAWWVLRGLELIGQSLPHPDERNDHLAIVTKARSMWNRYTEACGQPILLEAEIEPLETAAQALIATLRLEIPQASYQSLDKAWGLVADYKNGKFRNGIIAIRDVINAAWLIKSDALPKVDQVDQIAAWSVALSRRV